MQVTKCLFLLLIFSNNFIISAEMSDSYVEVIIENRTDSKIPGISKISIDNRKERKSASINSGCKKEEKIDSSVYVHFQLGSYISQSFHIRKKFHLSVQNFSGSTGLLVFDIDKESISILNGLEGSAKNLLNIELIGIQRVADGDFVFYIEDNKIIKKDIRILSSELQIAANKIVSWFVIL